MVCSLDQAFGGIEDIKIKKKKQKKINKVRKLSIPKKLEPLIDILMKKQVVSYLLMVRNLYIQGVIILFQDLKTYRNIIPIQINQNH